MVTYDLYRYIFIAGLILSIVFLIATVLIFFLLNIKTAIGDITGTNKRKAIEDINNKNASATEVSNKPVNARNYESKSTSAKLAIEMAGTSKIRPQDRFDNLGAETTMLDQSAAETSALTLCEQPPEAPAVASTAKPVVQPAHTDNDPNFIIEVDVTYVHSSEYIK